MQLNTRGDSVNVYPAPAVVPDNISTVSAPLFQIFSYSILRDLLDAWNDCLFGFWQGKCRNFEFTYSLLINNFLNISEQNFSFEGDTIFFAASLSQL